MIKKINNQKRTCRACGCTEDNSIQCIKKTGSPCYWVEPDLCSACEPIQYKTDSKPILSQRLVRLMGWIIFTSLAFTVFPSCNGPKACQKHIRKAILNGCLDTTTKVRIKRDTTTKEVNIKDSGKTIELDTAALRKYFGSDTCITITRAQGLNQFLKLQSIERFDSTYNLKIWIQDGKIKYSLWIKPCIQTTIERTGPTIIDKTEESRLWRIIWILGILLLLLIVLIIILILRGLSPQNTLKQ